MLGSVSDVAGEPVVRIGRLLATVLLVAWLPCAAQGSEAEARRLLDSAVALSTAGDAILAPGLMYGANPLDFISLALALVLGTAGLPHVLMRFYTVPTAKEARRSVVWAIWLIGAFYIFTLVLGFGAASLVGADTVLAAPGGVNSAAPLLALALGGPLLLGFISAIAFATILAVVAGITITAATSFAHDIYGSVIKKGK